MKASELRNIIREEIENQLSLFPRGDVSATAYRKGKDNDRTREEKETQLMHVINPKTDSAVKSMFGPKVKWSHRKDPKRITWQGVDKAGNGAWVRLRLEVTPTSGIGAGNPIDVYGYVPIAGKPPSDGAFKGLPLMGVGLDVNQGNKYKKNPLDTKQLEMFRDYVMSLSVGEVKNAMASSNAKAPKSFSELLSNNKHAIAMVDGLTGGDSEYGGYNFNQIVTQFYDDYKAKQNLLGKFRLKEDLTSNPYKVWKEKSSTESDSDGVSDMIASIDSKKFPKFLKDFLTLFPNTGKLTMERLDRMIYRFFEHGMIAREDKATLMNIIKKALK